MKPLYTAFLILFSFVNVFSQYDNFVLLDSVVFDDFSYDLTEYDQNDNLISYSRYSNETLDFEIRNKFNSDHKISSWTYYEGVESVKELICEISYPNDTMNIESCYTVMNNEKDKLDRETEKHFSSLTNKILSQRYYKYGDGDIWYVETRNFFSEFDLVDSSFTYSYNISSKGEELENPDNPSTKKYFIYDNDNRLIKREIYLNRGSVLELDSRLLLSYPDSVENLIIEHSTLNLSSETPVDSRAGYLVLDEKVKNFPDDIFRFPTDYWPETAVQQWFIYQFNNGVWEVVDLDLLFYYQEKEVVGFSPSVKNNFDVDLYPNPVKSVLSFGDINDLIDHIEVYDLYGNLLISKKDSRTIDVSDLNTGNYSARVISLDEKVITKVFTVAH